MIANDEKVCPRCAETIKVGAKVCRYCGHEFDETPAPAETLRKPLAIQINGKPATLDGNASKERASKFKGGCAAVFVIIIILAVIGSLIGNNKTGSSPSSNDTTNSGASASDSSSTPPAKSCKDNWTDCADNGDLVNNWSGWVETQSACEVEAEGEAKYGAPKWPWIVFGSFRPGDSYIKTGIATAIEPDAQFQNGFGAMVHSEVICQYDLRAKKVIDVSITPR